MSCRRLPLHLLLASFLAAQPASSQVPQLLGLQGRLLRADGTAATGTATAAFGVWDSATGGSRLWFETQTLGLSDGYYATFLGLADPPPVGLFDGGSRWLEIAVGSETLSPRQRIGSVPFAAVAASVRGGGADVLSLKVGGQTVIDSTGRLAGSARYGAGPGLSFDEGAQTLALQACAPGEALVRDATGWQCTAHSPGTVTSVSAAAPLAVANGSTTPQITLLRAGTYASGYLASADFASFDAKYGADSVCGGDLQGTLAAPTVARLQSRPVAATQPATGQVLKWAGTRWEPADDDDSGGTLTNLTVHAPLTVWNGDSTPDVSIAAAGAAADGFLSSADWARFNGKYDASTQCVGDLAGTFGAPLVAKLQGVSVATATPSAAQVLRFDGNAWAPASLGIADVGGLSGGYLDLSGAQTIGGTKTFSTAPVFGTPLGTASGGIGTASAAANAVFAGPASGAAASPSFRPLVAADLPDLDASRITGGTLAVARGGTGTSVAFAPGALVFAGADGSYSHNNPALHWDDAYARLGIGTTSPAYRLDVQGGDLNVSGDLRAGGTLYAAGVSAPVTGNVTGNLSGNVTGNVTGNLTGNVTGSLNGSVTGNVTGDLAGNVTGNVTGGLTGNVTGNVTGNLTGGVKLTGTAATCNSATAGTVQWDGSHFFGCTGTAWRQFDNQPPPTITSVTPTSGVASGGTVITILGSGFVGGAMVRVADVAATSVTWVSASQLTAVTPAGSAGAKELRVENLDGQAVTSVFTYNPLPTVASVTPSSGPRGSVVTIAGTNLVSGATVTVGGTSATVGSTSATQITATVPPGGSAGARAVRVTNPDTGYAELANGFTYACATGGNTVNVVSGNCTHTFTSTGTATFSTPAALTADLLVVAGGGSAGSNNGGGGGGGGVIYNTGISVTSGSYSIVVGAGAPGYQNSSGPSGTRGSNSSALGYTAVGGGGGTGGNAGSCTTGGSGGGNGRSRDGSSGGCAGTSGQGKQGRQNPDGAVGGGGGGAGQGQAEIGAGNVGGNGVQISISGTATYYGGGGGGGDERGGTPYGGSGGGGRGGSTASGFTRAGLDGTPNTGGGGGGDVNGDAYCGGGGSGIVIIRYAF